MAQMARQILECQAVRNWFIRQFQRLNVMLLNRDEMYLLGAIEYLKANNAKANS